MHSVTEIATLVNDPQPGLTTWLRLLLHRPRRGRQRYCLEHPVAVEGIVPCAWLEQQVDDTVVDIDAAEQRRRDLAGDAQVRQRERRRRHWSKVAGELLGNALFASRRTTTRS